MHGKHTQDGESTGNYKVTVEYSQIMLIGKLVRYITRVIVFGYVNKLSFHNKIP